MDRQDDDPLTTILSRRRIPHTSGYGRKTKAAFDPRRLFGVYSIGVPALPTHLPPQSTRGHTLEIHEFTRDDAAVLGTLSLGGALEGMCVLAGSRTGLQAAVDGLEQDEGEESEDSDQQSSPAGSSSAGLDAELVVTDKQEGEVDAPVDDDAAPADPADRRQRRRHGAFEKNSFRNPKFWMRWRGRVLVRVAGAADDAQASVSDAAAEELQPQERVETNTGYIVFASNECMSFKGTITCAVLGWENAEVSGWKLTGKARACPVSWSDLG